MRSNLPVGLPVGLYTAGGVRALDAAAIGSGIAGLTLMRRAATACVEIITDRWPNAQNIDVFCGSGNNAGDGYLIAGILAEKSKLVRVFSIGDPERLGPDARAAYDYCRNTAATFVTFEPNIACQSDVIVDGLLGTGVKGNVRDEYVTSIEWINACDVPVLSVDVPSGLCSDTGTILGSAVVADVTVTFIGLKRGMFTLDGPDMSGVVIFDDLDVPDPTYANIATSARRLELRTLMKSFPPRPKNAYKNKFGHVLVVGGDEGMGGAVCMSAEAALRSGAGLVSVAAHPGHINAILARRPELMAKGITEPRDLMPMLARASVIVLGPGLGRSQWSTEVFRRVLDETDEQKLVVDADGLNLLALHPVKRDGWVLTPHPGEASNLLQDNRIQADRFKSVHDLQQKYGGTVLLKGAGTLVSDGETMYLCSDGNPGMSTAGMGDVLSGIIGGLLAQGLAESEATRLGVLVHALAGDACAEEAGERGLAATDLFPHVRRFLNTDV